MYDDIVTWLKTYWLEPDTMPRMDEKPKFDPLFGFPKGRKERVMIATKDEMMSTRLEHTLRDFCAHLAIEYYACTSRHAPWFVPCAPERHAWSKCNFDDWVLRMKEFERERRMLLRAKRVPIENAGWKQRDVEAE